jgi:signal transduction histidine kinase/ActR/RegA family two-component response regulator
MFIQFKNKNFRQQFLINFIIIVMTFSAISFILLIFTWSSLEKQQLRIVESYGKSAAADIDGWIAEKKLNLKTQALFLEELGEAKLASDDVRRIMFHQVILDPSITDLLIIDAQCNTINSLNYSMKDFSPYAASFFKKGLEGSSVISGLFRGPDHQYFLMIGEPFDLNGASHYLLVGIINLDKLASIVDNLNCGAMGHGYLVNRDGQLLIQTQLFDYMLTKNFTTHTFTERDSYAIQQINRRKSGKGIYRDTLGKKVLGFFQWIEPLQAGLIIEFYDYHLMQPIFQLFRISGFLVLIVIFLGLLIAYLMSKKATRNIDILVDVASNIANQEYRQPLQLKTNTEFDILIDKFNQMQTAIKAREETLKETNAELKAQRAEALEATKMKSQFLANMSHELRTPLNSIIGFTGRVIHKCRTILPPPQLENLEIVKSEAQNLLALINDLLDFSKIEAGKMEVYDEDFDLLEVVNEVGHIIQPLQESKSLGFILDIDPQDNLPITSDKTKVKEILINLLSNAFKYSEKGTVTLSIHQESGNYRISVIDQGIGIASENLQNIFDEFRQVDGTYTRKVGGTGLGLAITKKFVEMLNGKIIVDSILGEGSIFTVYLPICFVQRGSALNLKDTHMDSRCPTSKIKVACIDDDPSVCRLYQQYLEESGIDVVAFNDQEDIIAQVIKEKPDVILLDIILPQKDGWEILAELKTNHETKTIPIIMISILSEKNLAYRLKADEYLIKPVGQEELTGAIQRLLSFTTRGNQ